MAFLGEHLLAISAILNSGKRRLVRMAPTLALALALLVWFTPSAYAVPSMARQTGYACSRCHTVFPELTPFGRQFKLGAYAMSSEKWDARPLINRLPVAAALQISQTNTSSTSAGGTMPEDFEYNGELILQTLALYYGGQITKHSGALAQFNYNGFDKAWVMEMFDARYAHEFSHGDSENTIGVTLNNSPSLSDIYNSTPAWGFPHTETAASQMPPSTVVDMMLGSQVGGITAYTMWNDLIYAEAGVYRTTATGALRFLGHGVPTELVLEGNNPYWRLALQQEHGKHSFELGTFALHAKIQQDAGDPATLTNTFSDYAFDGSYQYLNGNHAFSTHAVWIHEKQKWDAAYPAGMTSNASDTLTTLRVDSHYSFQRSLAGAIQYFRTTGTTDQLLYNTGDPLMGSDRGSPDSHGWVGEFDYLPTDRIKLSLRYTLYQTFNGASSNYMPGRDASDNDSTYILAWILF